MTMEMIFGNTSLHWKAAAFFPVSTVLKYAWVVSRAYFRIDEHIKTIAPTMIHEVNLKN